MNKILRKIGFLSILSFSSLNAQVYLNENFDGAFTGSPAAPAGWTQTRIVVVGDGIPDPGGTGEKDWQQISNTGLAAWTSTWTFGTFPNAANTGSNVIAINDYDFGGTGSALGTRRMESPVINLVASTNPYVRFMLFSGTATSFLNLRVVGSLDGGTTWSVLSNIMPNADVLTFNSSTPWQPVNVKIPPAFKVPSAKFGFEITNSYSGQNYYIDDFKVEEFTPATITSSASGAWSNPATWSGGVVPNANNNVIIAASHSVGIDVTAVRCQNLTVDGLLNHAATTNMLQVYENCTVSATGTLVSGNTTTGRKTYFGGNIVNNGLMNFYPGTSTAAHLVWAGFSGNYSGTGVFTNSRVPNISHITQNGVSYSNPVNVTNFCGLYLGQVNGTNLSVGNPSVAAVFATERYLGAYSTSPIYNNTNVNQRNLTYITPLTSLNSGLYMTYAPTNVTPGEEVELISANRWNTGNLIMNTHNNITLAYPLTVGTTTGTTQNITMTRGIINTTTLNLLILNPSATGAIGTAPTTVTNTGINTGNHGSFINGPLQIRFPATGTVARNFPLGSGSAFHNNLPSSNVLRTVSLGGTTAWNSQTITATIENAPTGPVTPTLTAVFGSRAYRLNYNGGPVLGSGNTITMRYNNSTFGGSDNLSGNQQDVRIVQAPALNGTWVEKSLTTGTGAMAPNTLYTIVSNTTASGGPLTNDQFFAWATTGNVCTGVPTTPTITGAISSCGGAATTLTLTSPSSSLVGISNQWASSTSSVGPFTNMGTALTQNTGTLGTSMFYIVTTSCSISGSVVVTPVYTLQLNPNPTVTAVSSSSTYCNPSASPLSFTASGANTYTWSPAASLSSSVGANVTGTLSAATVFSVTGTNTLTGCTSANGTIAVSVNPGIASTTISASANNICSGNNSTLSVNFSNTSFAYCIPSYATGTSLGDYITNVTLATLTNTTGALAAPFYTLYPSTFATTTLTAGTAYTISLQAGTYTANDFGVWIDYNQNGVLELSEKLGEINDLGATPAIGTITFTVPLTALNGSNVRLRVRELDGSVPGNIDPCATQSSFGEVEDYEITIVGGVTPIGSSFLWSPATALSSTTLQTTVANPTATTNYSVNITNVYGCSTQTNITLNVTPSPTITIAGPTVACSGSTVNLTASGASSYTWNTGATTTSISVSPTVNTTYTASGTGTTGCVGTKTITVNAGANPTISITGSSTVCSANSTTLTANGASTYSWNTGATTASLVASPTVNTTYTATGTSSVGCSGMAMVTVTVNAIPVVNLVASSTTVCANGNTLTLFGSPAGGAYSGSNVTGNSFAPSATAGSFTPVYSFTNTQGCSNTASVTINVLACSGINEKNAIVGLSVYPNPNNGVFLVDLNTSALKTITITDVTGRVVYTTTTNDTKHTIKLNNLTNGVYFAQISTEGKTNTFKLVKE